MADIKSLERALINADAAGDVEAARELAQAIKQARITPQAAPITPQTAPITSTVANLGRQLGLTARYGIEGLADAASIFTEPVRSVMTLAGVNAKPISKLASQAADWMRLPSPETPDERVVGDAAKLVASAGGFGLLGKGMQAAQTSPNLVGKVGELFSSNMGAQAASAAGAGLAGGTAREMGVSPGGQMAASVGGAVAGGLVPSVVNAGASAVRGAALQFRPQEIDARVTATLAQAGVDFSTLGTGLQNQIREDARRALATGSDLDPAALSRLVDFRRQGMTPTVGMLTLDPVQITREQNLARMGANTADAELQGLARVYNQNNARMVDRLQTMGAQRGDLFAAGDQAVGAINARDAAWQRRVSDLYTQARNMPGGDIPLDRKTLVDNIFANLARENKMAFLPESIGNMLNDISLGQVTRGGQTFQVPFNVNALDNLMTSIAAAQRSTTDGNTRAALSLVRQAIDNTPITPVKTNFGGAQVVTPQTAATMRTADQAAPEFMQALNNARAEARARFDWREGTRPVDAVISGMEPDNFIKRFVLNGTVADAAAVAGEANRPAVRDAIVRHIYDQATGGAAPEVAKVSQSSLNKAINNIGERKLALFFDADEIAQLRSLGRVASYTQVQPTGSAVNNSNSGALMLGKGYDAIQLLANRFPMGRALITEPINTISTSVMTNRARDVPRGLLSQPADAKSGFVPGLLAPLAITGGLLLQ